MKVAKLDDMIKGWFVGKFSPTLYETNDVEVAVKNYKEGNHEKEHYHKIATELTVIVKGTVEMNGKKYSEGDMIVVEPCESTDFLAITDATTTVVKIPGANDDKYMGKYSG